MTTNEDQGAAADPVSTAVEVLRGMNWPGAVALLGLVALFVLGPRFGVDPGQTAAGVAAVIAAYGLSHARKANKQTNGALTGRIRAEVERGTAALRADLPELIRSALDTSPMPDPWAPDGGNIPDEGGNVPYPRL